MVGGGLELQAARVRRLTESAKPANARRGRSAKGRYRDIRTPIRCTTKPCRPVIPVPTVAHYSLARPAASIGGKPAEIGPAGAAGRFSSVGLTLEAELVVADALRQVIDELGGR